MRLSVFHAAMIAMVATACRSQDSVQKATCGDGCQSETAHILRTYQVPQGQDKTVARLLRGNMYPIQVTGAQGTQTQFVHLNPQLTGDGYFVLSAPIGIHEGVRQLLEELKSRRPKTGSPSVDVTYWLVLGYPSKESVIPDQLADLAPALKTMTNLGAMRFELFEKLEVNALDGEEARAKGARVELKQTASIDKDDVELRIEAQTAGDPWNKMETVITTHPGQFAALGQSGFHFQGAPATDLPTLFYVIRAKPST